MGDRVGLREIAAYWRNVESIARSDFLALGKKYLRASLVMLVITCGLGLLRAFLAVAPANRGEAIINAVVWPLAAWGLFALYLFSFARYRAAARLTAHHKERLTEAGAALKAAEERAADMSDEVGQAFRAIREMQLTPGEWTDPPTAEKAFLDLYPKLAVGFAKYQAKGMALQVGLKPTGVGAAAFLESLAEHRLVRVDLTEEAPERHRYQLGDLAYQVRIRLRANPRT